jgi:hypothetical protein
MRRRPGRAAGGRSRCRRACWRRSLAQSQLVIQAQRLRRQAGQPGELTDAHQVHGRLPRARPTPGSPDCAASPRVKVKLAVCRPAGQPGRAAALAAQHLGQLAATAWISVRRGRGEPAADVSRNTPDRGTLRADPRLAACTIDLTTAGKGYAATGRLAELARLGTRTRCGPRTTRSPRQQGHAHLCQGAGQQTPAPPPHPHPHRHRPTSPPTRPASAGGRHRDGRTGGAMRHHRRPQAARHHGVAACATCPDPGGRPRGVTSTMRAVRSVRRCRR